MTEALKNPYLPPNYPGASEMAQFFLGTPHCRHHLGFDDHDDEWERNSENSQWDGDITHARSWCKQLLGYVAAADVKIPWATVAKRSLELNLRLLDELDPNHDGRSTLRQFLDAIRDPQAQP